MNNKEWLKSLTDRQLDEEIKYGKILAEGYDHQEHYQRDLEEAIQEKQERDKCK